MDSSQFGRYESVLPMEKIFYYLALVSKLIVTAH
jgi:hypothetical protein